MGMWDTPFIPGYTVTSGGYVPINTAPAVPPSWYANAYAAGIDPTSTNLTYDFRQDPTGQLAAMKVQALVLAQQQGRGTAMSAADLAGAKDWAKQVILQNLGLSNTATADSYNGWKANGDNSVLNPMAKYNSAFDSLPARDRWAMQQQELAAYNANPDAYVNNILNGIKTWTVGGSDNQQFFYDPASGQLVNAVKKNTDESQMALAALAATGMGLAGAGLLGGGAAGTTTLAPEVAATTGAVTSPIATGAVTATDLGLLGGTAPETAGAFGAGTAAYDAAIGASAAAPEVAVGTAAGASGAGALTPAQIESAVGTAGYGPSAAASAATGAASGGSGLSNYLANIVGSANPQQAALTAIANSTGLDSSALSALGINTGSGTSGTGTTGTSSSNGLLSTGANALGSYLNYQSAKEAAQTQADAQIKAAQIAADAAKFKPVGVTTGFGSSQFGFDANGNLTSAGYQLTPQMQAQRDALLGTSGGLLQQFQGSQAATAPMGAAAQQAMQLGQGYLSTDPQAQAQKYLNDQLALLAPSRADAMAQLQAQMQAQGRGGFAIGGGVNGQGAANPQLQALLNAQMQQNAQLAANATQGGMDYAKFGVDMTGAGGNLLSGMYGAQTAAFNPYKTALGGAQTVEGLGQNALTTGMDLGNTVTAANAKSGGLLASGMTNAANTMAPVNSTSLWGQGLLNLANQWGQ